MKQSVVIIALLFITPYIRAQSELVKPSELIFHSPLEEQTINGFIENDQLDYLALFLCIDPTQTQTELNLLRCYLIVTSSNLSFSIYPSNFSPMAMGPTPLGVPVNIRSPFLSVKNFDR